MIDASDISILRIFSNTSTAPCPANVVTLFFPKKKNLVSFYLNMHEKHVKYPPLNIHNSSMTIFEGQLFSIFLDFFGISSNKVQVMRF